MLCFSSSIGIWRIMTVSTFNAATTTTFGDDVVMLGGIISVERTDTGVTYRVTGSVDLSNASTFAEVVSRDQEDGQTVVFDLSGVDFFGTAALSVVAALDAEHGENLTLVVGDAVTRVMGAARWQPTARVTR